MKKAISFLAIVLFALSSCTSFCQIEKRHYRNGFYFHSDNFHEKIFSGNSSSTLSSEKPVQGKRNKVSEVKSSPVFQKVEVLPKKKFISFRNKIAHSFPAKIFSVMPKTVHSGISANDESPEEHDVAVATIFGVVALVLVVLGLLLIETAIFAVVPLIIGLMFAFLGLKFGRSAIYKSTKKHSKEMTEDEIQERKKKVKRSYFLNLFAILFFFLYLLIRFGIVAAFNIYGLAVLLVAIALVLYLLFRMGVFSDLKAMKNQSK